MAVRQNPISSPYCPVQKDGLTAILKMKAGWLIYLLSISPLVFIFSPSASRLFALFKFYWG
jgi:hypothetical protein